MSDLNAKVFKKVNKEGKEYYQVLIYLPNDDEPLSESIYVDSTMKKLFTLSGVEIHEEK